MKDKDRLFAVCLGGRAEGCNTELHDVVFVTGPSIEATYDQLLDRWFGLPEGLHIDVWAELDVVDGHRVSLSPEPPAAGAKLWFVNLGAYRSGEFAEAHAVAFLVAQSAAEAKRRAKAQLLEGADELHTDDLYDIDGCLEVAAVGELHVVLTPTDHAASPSIHAGYRPLPNDVIATHIAKRASGAHS